MPTATASTVFQHLRQAALLGDGPEISDGQLLEAFLNQRDEAAFGMLVRRHGPMVLGVCKRVIGNSHDAEDAFQATFLVLVRKGATVVPREAVGNWLYGVAYRTARHARAADVRRGSREKQVKTMPQPMVDAAESMAELDAILDEELSRLPDKYRLPLVLFDLEGRPRKEVARRLKLPEGTLSSRLARGRKMLAGRLARRGVVLSGGALALVLGAKASACVPLPLVSSTTKAAATLAAGGAATEFVSVQVAALAQGVVKLMFLSKLKTATAVLLVVLVSLGTAAALAQISAAGPGVSAYVAQPASENAKQATPTWKIGPTLLGHGDRVWEVAFSPDGKRLASSSSDKSVMIWDVARREAVQTLKHAGAIHSVAFAPDGKTLATSSGYDNEDYLISFWDPETGREQAAWKGHRHPVQGVTFARNGKMLVSAIGSNDHRTTLPADSGEVVFWDVATQTKNATLKVEWVHTALLSHDGKRLVTASGEGVVKLWELDDKFAATKETVLEQGLVCSLIAAPDGKSFVIVPVSTRQPVAINLWDFATGHILKTFEHKDVASVQSAAFAPDGKTLATGCRKEIKKGDGAELGELAGEVKFWDIATMQEKQILRERLGPINALAYAPDGKTLVVGLLHKENLKLKEGEGKGGGGYEPPAEGYSGGVILCELK